MQRTSPFFDHDWLSSQWKSYSIDTPPASQQTSTFAGASRTTGQLTPNTESLIDAIAMGNAVVYAGAGVSKSAGLKDWRGFLADLANDARRYSPTAAASITNCIQRGDYLVAAEMLQNVLGQNLQNIVHRTFGQASVPTPIHKAIAAIPFSLAITTNYDCLLEKAYPFSAPRLTWQNPHDVLQNLRANIFCVLKLHGDYAVRNSLVLSRSHYRDLMNANASLLQSLKMLLATRTFLFVGVSFSDPDLLALMDETRAIYGDAFGPHFAIFPEEYHDSEYSAVLQKCYNVHTLVAAPQRDLGLQCDSVTGGVAALISHMGGLAAFSGRDKPFRHGLGQFSRETTGVFQTAGERLQFGWLLQNLVLRLGVSFGEIAMTNPEKHEQRVIYTTATYDISNTKPLYRDQFTDPKAPDTAQSRLFRQRKIEDDFILIRNVRLAEEELRDQGFGSSRFEPQLQGCNTVLCVPIYVDGRRSGVITLEAGAGYLFSRHHYLVARYFASQIGAARYEARKVKDSSSSLSPYSRDLVLLKRQLRKSRDLDDLDMDCLLYQIDAFRGKLVATLRTEDEILKNHGKKFWEYDIESRSLASETFRERRTIRIDDAERTDSDSANPVSPLGRDFFDIRGPICSFPVQVRGYIAGIFVGWSQLGRKNKNKSSPESTNARNDHLLAAPTARAGENSASLQFNTRDKRWRRQFWRGMERARRILHVLVNEPPREREISNLRYKPGGRGEQFFEALVNSLAAIDGGNSWGDRIKNAEFRRSIIDRVLKCLVEKPCGLRRVRLFVVFTKPNNELTTAVCVGSQENEAAVFPKHKADNGFLNITVKGPDPYVQFTLGRAPFDPYARLQDSTTLGGQQDPSETVFKKVKGRPWLVAPVGRQRFRPLDGMRIDMFTTGYLAADNFIWEKKSKLMIDAPVEGGGVWEEAEPFRFQSYCLDLAADVLANLLVYEKDARHDSA